jgi:hypothetical protein
MCGVSLLCVAAAGELGARPRTVVAGDGVRMRVEVPAGYSFRTEAGADGQQLVMLENPVWPILITVADILAESREQDYNFKPLNPDQGSGVYCVFSHPGAKRREELMPDQFLHVVAGIKVIRGAVMYFKIKTNDLESPEYQEALGLFVSGFDGS